MRHVVATLILTVTVACGQNTTNLRSIANLQEAAGDQTANEQETQVESQNQGEQVLVATLDKGEATEATESSTDTSANADTETVEEAISKYHFAAFFKNISETLGFGSFGVFGSVEDGGQAVVNVEPQPDVPADFNGDLVVNAADYTVWRDNLGATGASKSQGDADADGDVDGADYLEWQRNFGRGPYDFKILTPTGVIFEPTPTVSWEESFGAFSYDVQIATDKDCVNVVDSYVGVTTLSQQIAPLPPGTYFTCVFADNPLASSSAAAVIDIPTADFAAFNNGLEFTIQPVIGQDLEHVVFITNASFGVDSLAEPNPFSNDFGGLQSADFHCTAAAINAGLISGVSATDRVFKALISTSTTDARDRMLIEGRVVNTNGDLLANNEADFWDGTIAMGVNYDESGSLLPNNSIFWTGSDSIGQHDRACLDWTTTGGQMANVGLSQSIVSWFNQAQLSCGSAHRLVCISPAQPQ